MKDIDHICEVLGLPKGDKFTQDWAYELPEEFRTEKWLKIYIDAYLAEVYSKSEKNLLMELVLDVSNDLISKGSNRTVDKALDVLSLNRNNHLELIEYWSQDGESLEDCFALTPKIRAIKGKSHDGFKGN